MKFGSTSVQASERIFASVTKANLDVRFVVLYEFGGMLIDDCGCACSLRCLVRTPQRLYLTVLPLDQVSLGLESMGSYVVLFCALLSSCLCRVSLLEHKFFESVSLPPLSLYCVILT